MSVKLRDLLAARQRDELRVSQRDYLRDRFANLESLHKPELSADLALIAGIAQIGAGRSSILGSQPRERGVRPNSVLEELYRIVKERLPPDIIRDVNDDCFNPDWIKTDYCPGLRVVSLLKGAFWSIC
jgi:hypothetical protein